MLFFDIIPKEINILILYYIDYPSSLYSLKHIFNEILSDKYFWINKSKREFPLIKTKLNFNRNIETNILDYKKVLQSYNSTTQILFYYITIEGSSLRIREGAEFIHVINLKYMGYFLLDILFPASAHNIIMKDHTYRNYTTEKLIELVKYPRVPISEDVKEKFLTDFLTGIYVKMTIFTRDDGKNSGIFYQIVTDDNMYIYVVDKYDLFNFIFTSQYTEH